MTDGIDTEVWVEDFLTNLLELAGFDVIIEELSVDDGDNLTIQLSGEDSARVIGREGQVLDAISQMVVAAAIHGGITRRRIVVDVERYRERREKKIREDAEYYGKEVLATGRAYEFPPMTPRERRIVHMTIADMKGLETMSVGEGPDRFVRVVSR
jgi:spoIIIJ-associated protein